MSSLGNYDPNDPENAPLTEEEEQALQEQDRLMELRRRARAEKGQQPGPDA